MTPDQLTEDWFTGRVLAWGAPRLRDLPWRRTRDPWAVLVSEVMLQQTQVPRVVERWTRFVERFPTPTACAAAPLGDVLREWQGLGYPRRARNLHAAAIEVTRLDDFPRDLTGLLALPGVGAYTARAVMAFAFECDEAVVDTNIARIYARQAGRRLTAKEVQAAADAHVPHGDGWAWNQCLMDLGAVVCRPKPMCTDCPVERSCAWRGGARRGGESSSLDDPAVGSSGVSGRQTRFEGSDRQARGRMMKALTAGPVAVAAVAEVMGRDDENSRPLVDALIAEGLCARAGAWLVLP
ncbi:MAG TPA: A/G-specific adenine glycosylase [Ilumatobacter sp.]|nr:A/G-specific adenine glycosylase [Ilumatobacter sp.]